MASEMSHLDLVEGADWDIAIGFVYFALDICHQYAECARMVSLMWRGETMLPIRSSSAQAATRRIQGCCRSPSNNRGQLQDRW